MGALYCALDCQGGQTVALRVFHSSLLIGTERRDRLMQGAGAWASLKHERIASVQDYGVDRGTAWLAMEPVVGRPLYPNTRELCRILQTFLGICEAVQHAHERGLVHEALNPERILVDEAGVPKVSDFRLASDSLKDLLRDKYGVLSEKRELRSMLPFVAPEQTLSSGPKASPQTDIYALGVLLQWALTGLLPYETTGAVRELLERIRYSAPCTGSLSRLPDGGRLQAIVGRCLEKETQARYASVAALADEVGEYLAGAPARSATHHPRRNRLLVFLGLNAREVDTG